MKAAALVLLLASCSLVTTQSPRPYPEEPDCTTSRGTVAVDVLGALVGAPVLALLMWAGTDDRADISESTEETLIGVTYAGSFLTFTASAIIGAARTGRCQSAYERFHYMRPGMAPPPTPYTPQEPPAGTERGFCRPDGGCDPGLTCASNRCVVLPN